jgi:cytochrome P450
VLKNKSIILILGAQFKRHAAVTLPLFRRAKVISNFDLINDCVDKLLDNWHKKPKDHIHTDITQQSQNLLLQIFGLIAFDYDLQTLDYDYNKKATNELTQALNDLLPVWEIVLYAPKAFSTVYLKLNYRYQQARRIIKKHLDRMIEQELNEDPKLRLERKRTCLIASLVDSLHQDENAEAMKSEEEKKGTSL